MITKIRHSTFNCRGLNNLTDILKLNDILKKEKIDICHLQEIHISKKENKEKLLLYLKEFDVFYDLTASESKGVAIIVKKSLKYKIVNIHFYSERIIMLKIEIFDTIFNFVNIYSPNSIEEQISFVEMVTNLISGLKNVILSGDFNSVENNRTDRINQKQRVRNDFTKNQKIWKIFYKDFGLNEQILNGCKEMTWSNNIQSSRLDRIYSNFKNEKNNIHLVKTIFTTFSDHKMVISDINVSKKSFDKNSLKLDSSWKLNETVLDDEFVNRDIEAICGTIPELKVMFHEKWYENFIEKIIKSLKHHSRRLNDIRNEKINLLYDKLNLLKSNYNCADQTVLVAIKKVQDAISIYYKQKRLGIEKRACETKNNFIFRPTKVLISKEIDTQKSNQITNFKINEKTTQDIKLIMEELEFFYKNLLGKERVSITKLNGYSFLSKKLNENDIESINQDISYNEALETIEKMKSAAPGPNGITLLFYKKYFHLFGREYVKLLNDKEGKLTKTFNEVKMKLIPKNNNQIKSVDDLRPISLTNYEYRIFTKILANRLNKVSDKLIEKHQTCSIKNRNMTDNIFLTKKIIEFSILKKKKVNIISVDQKKAFDSIDHKYLFKILEHINIGNFLLNNIKRLYSNTFVHISVNGYISNNFNICSGIKQGCPLSMLLYVIAIEELLLKIKQNNNIKGFKTCILKPIEIKSNAYADDVIGYVSNNESIDFFFEEFDKWGEHSGASINVTKTKILPINSDYDSSKYSVVNEMKILGIIFNQKGISEENYNKAVKKLKESMFLWGSTNLNLIERVTACRTFLLSKLWFIGNFYFFNNDNIKLINSKCFKFIWNNRTELIKRDFLINPKEKGGLNMVNLKAKINTIYLMNLIKIARRYEDEAFHLDIYFMKFNLTEIKFKNFNLIPSCEDKEQPIIVSKMIESLKQFRVIEKLNKKLEFSILNTKYGSKAIYKRFRDHFGISPTHEQQINMDWEKVYKNFHLRFLNSNLNELNYKILYNGLALNFKRDSCVKNKCFLCKRANEDLDHLFINCIETNKFFNFIKHKFKEKNLVQNKNNIYFLNLKNKDDLKLISSFKMSIWQIRESIRKKKEIRDRNIYFLKFFDNYLAL